MDIAKKKIINLQSRITQRTVHSKILSQIKYASKQLVFCLNRALDIAVTNMTVLVEGETGVGKESLARLVHEQSPRSKRELIVVDCATLDVNLMLADLFGHGKGAFTGADRVKQGYFELADGSSIFLDEIGELPLAVQIRLLRILQEGTFARLGETKVRKVNVRIIAATNKNLQEEMAAGKFRKDLFFRLNQFRIEIPPLRERQEDLILLANHFRSEAVSKGDPRAVRFSDGAMRFMKKYGWPGNVRELQSAITRALVNCQGKEIRPEHLELETETVQTTAKTVQATMKLSPSSYAPLTIKELEKYALATALDYTHGNQKKAAQILGISRRTIYYKTDKYRIDVENPLELIENLELPSSLTGNFKIRMLEKTIRVLKKERTERKRHSAKKTGFANPEDPDKAKEKIALPQNKSNDAKDVPSQILQLNGASEFVAKYPSIIPGKTTLKEASECARIAHFVVHLNKAGGNVSHAARLMRIKSTPLFIRKKTLLDKGFDIYELRKNKLFSKYEVPIGIPVKDLVKEVRKELFALLYRFFLGARKNIAGSLDISEDSYFRTARVYKIDKSIITEHDQALYEQRNSDYMFTSVDLEKEPGARIIRKGKTIPPLEDIVSALSREKRDLSKKNGRARSKISSLEKELKQRDLIEDGFLGEIEKLKKALGEARDEKAQMKNALDEIEKDPYRYFLSDRMSDAELGEVIINLVIKENNGFATKAWKNHTDTFRKLGIRSATILQGKVRKLGLANACKVTRKKFYEKTITLRIIEKNKYNLFSVAKYIGAPQDEVSNFCKKLLRSP